MGTRSISPLPSASERPNRLMITRSAPFSIAAVSRTARPASRSGSSRHPCAGAPPSVASPTTSRSGKYDDTQLRIFRVTGPATLDDPNRSVAGTVEIGGEAGDQRVRVFASTVNQGRQIGLGVEGQAASLSIYSCVYIELLDVGKPPVHLRRDRPNRARQHFA